MSTEGEVEKLEWLRLFFYEIICDRLRVNLYAEIVGRTFDLRLFPGGRCSGHDNWEECL